MQKLTKQSVLFLQIMMSEPEFMKELIDGRDITCYSRVDINRDTGSIVLGKTRFNWWNRLVGDIKEISLETFAFKAMAFLGAKGEQEGHDKNITRGLLDDITDALHRKGRSNEIIDRLFMVGYFCVKTTWSSFSLETLGMSENNNDREVNIHVQGESYRKQFRAKNGDFGVELVIGPTGARLVLLAIRRLILNNTNPLIHTEYRSCKYDERDYQYI